MAKPAKYNNPAVNNSKSKKDKDAKTEVALTVLAENRRARHEYEIIQVFQAGIELLGTEVKSIRQRKVNLKDSFAKIEDKQLWLWNCHIAVYDFGNRFNHEPTRRRRLLMHRNEIFKINQQIKEKGLTLVPLRMYMKKNWVKLDIALAKGKKLYDKRESKIKHETTRQLDKLVKQINRR
jgi:SsrA-binding protein